MKKMLNEDKTRDEMIKVGEKLKKIRKAVGLSQGKLVDKLAENNGGDTVIERDTLSKIERGERSLTEKNAKKIGDILGVRADYLLGRDNYKTEIEAKRGKKLENFNRLFSQMAITAKPISDLIEGLAHQNELEIISLESGTEPQGKTLDVDTFAFVDGDMIVALFSLEDYLGLKKELLHYANYLFENFLAESEKELAAPFSLPKEDE